MEMKLKDAGNTFSMMDGFVKGNETAIIIINDIIFHHPAL
jgi:hypothetical protein